jgi:hypothetical protein
VLLRQDGFNRGDEIAIDTKIAEVLKIELDRAIQGKLQTQ